MHYQIEFQFHAVGLRLGCVHLHDLGEGHFLVVDQLATVPAGLRTGSDAATTERTSNSVVSFTRRKAQEEAWTTRPLTTSNHQKPNKARAQSSREVDNAPEAECVGGEQDELRHAEADAARVRRL